MTPMRCSSSLRRSAPARGDRRAVEGDALLGAALVAEQIVDAREQLRRVRLERERPSVERDGPLHVPARGLRLGRLLRERRQLVAGHVAVADRLGEDRRASLRIAPRAAGPVEPIEPLAQRLLVLPPPPPGRGPPTSTAARGLGRPGSRRELRGLAQRRQALVDRLGQPAAKLEQLEEGPGRLLAPVHRLEHARGLQTVISERRELLERRPRRLVGRVEARAPRRTPRSRRRCRAAAACEGCRGATSPTRGRSRRAARRSARAPARARGHCRCASSSGMSSARTSSAGPKRSTMARHEAIAAAASFVADERTSAAFIIPARALASSVSSFACSSSRRACFSGSPLAS